MTSGWRRKAWQSSVLVGLGSWAGCFGSDHHPSDGSGARDDRASRDGDAAVVAPPARECAMVCSRMGEDPSGEPFHYFLSLQEMVDGRFRVDCTAGGSSGTARSFRLQFDPTKDECQLARAGGCGGGNVMRADGGPTLRRFFDYVFGKEGIDVVVTTETFDDSEEPRTTAFTIPYEECQGPRSRFAPGPDEELPEFR